jgi:RimJ/RimL family protein N-acetyltransferase
MIVLTPLSKEDVRFFYKWIADEEVIKYSLSAFSKFKTQAEIDNWYFEMLEDKQSINLGISLKSTGSLVGYAGISKLSKINKSGEYFVFIGEKQYWGKGLGTEVTKQVLETGFNDYGLNRIMLTVSEPNIGGIKAYERAGFKTEGHLRQACFRNGQYHDKIVMSVLRSEWESRSTVEGIT